MSAPAKTLALMAMLAFAAGLAQAAPIDLDGLVQCSLGDATDGIDVTDVTGNLGGSTDCWGVFDGNDPGPSGDGFETMGMQFDYLAKWDDDDGLKDPLDIGLSQTGIGTPSGTWEFTNGALGTDFLIVLKAGSIPGYGVWLFGGADNASTEGDWSLPWGKDLSHLTVYVKDDFPTRPPVRDMPEPGTLALLGAGLLGAGWLRRRRRS